MQYRAVSSDDLYVVKYEKNIMLLYEYLTLWKLANNKKDFNKEHLILRAHLSYTQSCELSFVLKIIRNNDSLKIKIG